MMKRRMLSYKICVNQGFPRSGGMYGTYVGPITIRAAQQLHRDVRDYVLSLRQASEWGMRGLQGTFPHCKKCLPGDSALRCLVIEAIVLVHNVRTDYVGHSQIQTVFGPENVRAENLQGYDRSSSSLSSSSCSSSRSFLFPSSLISMSSLRTVLLVER
jgi:hypothetical protein